MKEIPDHVIIFDGICNLCDYSVQFIIRNDSKKTFRFAAAQSERGRELQLASGVDTIRDGTVILLKSGHVYIRAEAALEIAKDLDKPWCYLTVLRFMPKGIREYLYSLVSKNRYNWFGKKQACLIPEGNMKDRFL